MNRTKRLFFSMLTLLCCSTGAWAEGELNGLFTINASGSKVQFSQGNLRYFCSTTAPEWRFAEQQYNYLDFDGSAYAENSGKWIDLFGYGTSGYNNGQTCYQPYSTSLNSSDYYTSNLTGNADWGYNAISNGGNAENSGWRTLTSAEWIYLFDSRTNAASKYGQASINGVNGMILLPDSWTLPDGLTFTPGNHDWKTNTYTIDQWIQMENAGAVFLPASGSRDGTSNPTKPNDNGLYRSSTDAYYLYFNNNSLQKCTASFRQYGDAVRLVKAYSDIQTDTEGYYLIGSVQDWQVFATLVQTTQAANAKMTADIDLGNDQTTIPTYKGTFDGQGHTLTVNLATTQDGYGPFLTLDGATIKNLHVTGTITNGSYQSFGGIVGYIGGLGPSMLTNCRSSVTLKSNFNDSNGSRIGGIVAGTSTNNNSITTLNMSDCLFDGKFEGTNNSNSNWSGLVGWINNTTVEISNSFSAPASVDINGKLYTIYGKILTFNESSSTLLNLYTTRDGKNTDTQGTKVTAEQLSDGTTSTALQNNRNEEVWVQDPLTNLPMLKTFATAAYTVPSSGIGTFSAKAKFAVSDGLTAHYCETYDEEKSTIGVVDIDGAVPANTGVVLKGTPGETYTLTGTNAAEGTVTDNALVAVTEATHVDAVSGDYTNFMMKGGKFIMIENSEVDVKMPANRAYLQILTALVPPTPSPARSVVLDWDDDATGIQAVRDSRPAVDGYYNLAGQRVAHPTKGLYIVGGRKVVIK